MFTYMQIHLYFVIPPIILLGLVYHPLIGRREVLKVLWLGFMATIWTTPWDNFILSQEGWSYPPHSIIGKIGYVPIEEHLFFILQPILIILLHSIFTYGRLLSFDLTIPQIPHKTDKQEKKAGKQESGAPASEVSTSKPDIPTPNHIQTLPRRPIPSLFWITLSLTGLRLVQKTNLYTALDYGFKQHMFYLSWILVWISPVIACLTFLGARCTTDDWRTICVGTGWLWVVDTIALRSGSWSISKETTLGVEVWRGLPLEEAIFFFLTTYLIVLSSSLISHLHTLLLLSPHLPPCPPSNPISHIKLLAEVAFNPPKMDQRILVGLKEAEQTLKRGSKSFEVAKLAFGREMRIGLVVVYAWCRVTDNLIDEPFPIFTDPHQLDRSSKSLEEARREILDSIRQHLVLTDTLSKRYPAQSYPLDELDKILDQIPNLTPEDRSAFHLFSLVIPRLVPIYPFLELCDGYSTDLEFPSKPLSSISQANQEDIADHLPIKTHGDLMKYADNVAGSIAGAICYLAWSILDSRSNTPVREYEFPQSSHGHERDVGETNAGADQLGNGLDEVTSQRLETIKSARLMGCSLQLVNISRDIIKDALISRLYIPLSWFASPKEILSILFPSPSPLTLSTKSYTEKLLALADELRDKSISSIEDLPRTSRAGVRTMVVSYYEIANAIRGNGGQVDERGIRVGKWRRIGRAGRAMWLGS
ncbi:hypothetical protein I302_104889 [Kwoniella bestiolae CBS 10118]|uniref:Bifunctional lycopene cyclase/phytoene synthase n=1 Tax=Kwoniella bestiolae CBS 10118 TaxID=1296100 RepID=A0A1B9FRG4_9TREE|nr:hypothetical protein I302_09040 [Kwoniella bestiolae CBS 10118]OCF21364.1 hypothetical protein I302_09040 [Kwoniella bestiolae CBS 10118]